MKERSPHTGIDLTDELHARLLLFLNGLDKLWRETGFTLHDIGTGIDIIFGDDWVAFDLNLIEGEWTFFLRDRRLYRYHEGQIVKVP